MPGGGLADAGGAPGGLTVLAPPVVRGARAMVCVAPPLVMSRADAENFVALARRCVDQLARELGRLP